MKALITGATGFIGHYGREIEDPAKHGRLTRADLMSGPRWRPDSVSNV